jgi:nucleotide-binding universal stress UspA family protein
MHVVRPYRTAPDYLYLDREAHRRAGAELRRKQVEMGRSVLAEAAETLAASGRPARTQIYVGDPATRILELADKQNADLIVAGARGCSRLERLLMGSVADRLLKEASCSVLIVH